MKKQQATDYMYASARIRAMENRMVGRERTDILSDAKDSTEVMAKLAEYGIAPAEENLAAEQAVGAIREHMLLSLLQTAHDEVASAVPDPTVYFWLRYPYDCNNIKTAVKCAIRGIDPTDMLFDFGTVPAEEVKRGVLEGKYQHFPTAMSCAVGEAREAFAKTGDPRKIDVILDKACYEDMLNATLAAGCDTMVGWVRAKIDLVNVMICLRILRMGQGEKGKLFMNEALLSGGTLDASLLENAYDGGEAALWSALAMGKYSALVKAVESTDQSLAAIEKCADDYWMDLVREGTRAPFGAEVPAGYLIGCETSVKNIRMILAAKDAGLSPAVIRERIRESYV